MRKGKKALSLLICLVLLVGLFPAAALAEGTEAVPAAELIPAEAGELSAEDLTEDPEALTDPIPASAEAEGDGETEEPAGTPEPLSPAEPEALPREETADEPEALPREVIADEPEAASGDVTGYHYEITPVLSPFPYYLYVKTDNPDPGSFRLVDRNSSFYKDGDSSYIKIPSGSYSYYAYRIDPGTYYVQQALYAGVDYEKPETWRVSGGYLFTTDGAYGDGGEFVLQRRLPGGNDISDWKYEDTSVRVSCPKLTLALDYVIQNYTTPGAGLFENLDAVQAGLNQIAVYPGDVYDSSKPNPDRPYPLLATSPYPELDFNTHLDYMFEEHQYGLGLYQFYPFILDSLSFPYMIRSVAQRLEPTCTVEQGDYHYEITVSFNGESRVYGGSGNGGRDPLFTELVPTLFRFDGTGPLDGGDVSAFCDKLLELKDAASQAVEVYKDQVEGQTFRETIRATGGTWVRVAAESWFGFGGTYGYVVPLGGLARIVSDAWVGDLYINENESIVTNLSFQEHPLSSIVVRGVSYTDQKGRDHLQDVIYDYDSETDTWRAPLFYSDNYWYSFAKDLPELFILTREQVEAMNLGGGSSPRSWPRISQSFSALRPLMKQ